MDAQHESRVKALRELGRASDHMHLEMGKINRLVNEHAEKQQVLADSRDSTLPHPTPHTSLTSLTRTTHHHHRCSPTTTT